MLASLRFQRFQRFQRFRGPEACNFFWKTNAISSTIGVRLPDRTILRGLYVSAVALLL